MDTNVSFNRPTERTRMTTTQQTTTYERVEAGDVQPGDRVARTRNAEFHEVAAIDQGATTVRFHYADHGGTDRPRRIALWWREVEASNDDRAEVVAIAEGLGSMADAEGSYHGEDVELAQALDTIVGHGLADDQAGTVDEDGGHWARVGRFCLVTDGQGFRRALTYTTEAAARIAIDLVGVEAS